MVSNIRRKLFLIEQLASRKTRLSALVVPTATLAQWSAVDLHGVFAWALEMLAAIGASGLFYYLFIHFFKKKI
jgi:hypothetical protein